MQGILFFLPQNIDCGYSLEPISGSNVYPQYMFLSKNKKKNINIFSAENVQFLKLKNLC